MTDSNPSRSDRRAFLTGDSWRGALQETAASVGHSLLAAAPPSRGSTLMLRTTAMACDFDVVLNPKGEHDQLEVASEALAQVHPLEAQLTVYRAQSEVLDLNERAPLDWVEVAPNLFQLLQRAAEIFELTDGAFDPTTGSLIQLWKASRRRDRLPTDEEIAAARSVTGMHLVEFDPARLAIRFQKTGVQLDLGAIGKGYAVDCIGDTLRNRGVANWLTHGGRSSVLASGIHATHDGWPIGLQNPLLPDRQALTLLLKDAAISTSGIAVQWFRLGGKRWGHILDPRSGWPVNQTLSVSVIADRAADADALSTACFVLGVEESLARRERLGIGLIAFPPPQERQEPRPIVAGLPKNRVFELA